LGKYVNILFFRVIVFAHFLLVLLPKDGFSQQDPVFTQYMNNLLTVQPAYAGISGVLNFTGISRAQWTGFEGAPNTNSLTISGPIRGYNIGVGFSLVNDKWGPLRQNGINVDYAFRIMLREDQFLSFGLKGEINTFQANFTDLRIWDSPDMVFMYDVKLKFIPNMGVGILWHSDRFFLGASSPKILLHDIQADDGQPAFREVRHFYGMGGYVFFITDIIKFKPTILYRWAKNTPNYVDFTASLLLYDQVWLGATYRMKNSVGLIFQYNVNPQLKFGYSFDKTTFHPTQVSSGTHEFMISYDFVTIRRGRRTTPKYF
jgi:type IX secretion system PorP/SprF family membrane protein